MSKYLSPRLRFIDPPAAPTGGAPAATPQAPATPPAAEPAIVAGAPVPTPPADAAGATEFPANTSEKDMTPEQSRAYWRYYSRKHEAHAIAEKARADALEQASRTDEQKREDALRAEGRAAAGLPFVQDAVTARLVLATGKTEEEVATLLEYVDVDKFVVDGRIDAVKVAAYAASVGTAPAAPPVLPLPHPAAGIAAAAAAMAARQAPGAPRVGTSINDARKVAREKYTKK